LAVLLLVAHRYELAGSEIVICCARLSGCARR
jgi:hypothetical protein